ncbi:restriction endonuclease subunit S [Mesotoga prima]|uniref:restriction endonuclease subunit S n=1 Tax=Mesotoga prima TaxID=1184387 RepID=UPI002D1F9FB3|nr:restriction endonuclease subunit S [Mesotoga prima]
MPVGYKKTEIGIIPEDWEVKQLGSFTHIRSRRVLPTNVDPETICIELEHIGQGNGRLCAYSKAVESESSKFLFFSGDILFGRLRPYLKKFWFAKQNGICSTEIWPLTVDTSDTHNKFFFYIVQTERFLEASEVSYGTHMPRADWKVLRELQIAVPPFSEQRAIAEVLTDVDNLIESLDNLIRKKQAIKKATMQQLLTGRFRLPGFEGEWKSVTIGSLGSVYGGLSGKNKQDFGEGNAFYVTFLNVLQNIVIDPNQFERVSVPKGESQNIVRKGDLLFNGTSETPDELAMGAAVPDDFGELYLNSFCFGFRIPDQVSWHPLFFAYLFRSCVGREMLRALSQGATRHNLSKSQFLRLVVCVPNYLEQRAITSILLDMDAEIEVLESRRDKIKQIKLGMMQQLLTGRTRLLSKEAV